jgi:hypothetical protein
LVSAHITCPKSSPDLSLSDPFLDLFLRVKMTITVTSILVSIVYVAVLRWAWRVLNWVWFRPKKVERCLRQQGFAGKPYRLLFGDWKESSDMLKEARTKPIGLSDALLPRVMPFLHQLVKDYGIQHATLYYLSRRKDYFSW